MHPQLISLLEQHFGFRAELKGMAGYGSLNFRVRDLHGRDYVLKLEKEASNVPFLEAENRVLRHLARQPDLPGEISVPQTSNSGVDLLEWTLRGPAKVWARLLSFVPGKLLAEVPSTSPLRRSLGAFIARVDLALQDLRPVAVERRYIIWDLQHCLDCEVYLPLIQDPHQRGLAAYFLQQYRERVQPAFPQLRKSLIYNDANDWNVLCQNGRVSGIIDFGDMSYTATVFELAVALAYACMNQHAPLEAAQDVIQGYHAHLPLTKQELALLYYLVAARLCTSVCLSAHSRHLYPDNEYITVSEAPAWALLQQWIEINPRQFHEASLNTCGFSPAPLPDLAQIQAQRERHISKSLKISYQEPLLLERGARQYLYDARGLTYLDAYNNVIQVGHCHPAVVRAAQGQMNRLNTNTRYLYRSLGAYAERLCSFFPEPLRYVFFVNSGSAATDLALRLAHHFTRREDLLVLEHGYHGNTETGITVSAYKFDGKGGTGAPKHVHKLPLPDPLNPQTEQDLQRSQGVLRNLKTQNRLPAALIAEPVVGCGGQVFLPEGYLAALFEEVRALGGVCIVDEVQTGFGRLGRHFWGFEQQEVMPDMVVLGKPMGNGHPLGAVVTTEAIARTFENGMEFFSSFGGNPVSCEVGLAVLEVLEAEQLPQQAETVGQYLWQGLRELQATHPIIRDVRGMGLFGGVELQIPGDTPQPATQEAKELVNRLRQEGILLGTDGPFDNVVKIKPPLCFNQANAASLIEAFSKYLPTLMDG
jgi:ethanolamine-phosphate phospho-lyase